MNKHTIWVHERCYQLGLTDLFCVPMRASCLVHGYVAQPRLAYCATLLHMTTVSVKPQILIIQELLENAVLCVVKWPSSCGCSQITLSGVLLLKTINRHFQTTKQVTTASFKACYLCHSLHKDLTPQVPTCRLSQGGVCRIPGPPTSVQSVNYSATEPIDSIDLMEERGIFH